MKLLKSPWAWILTLLFFGFTGMIFLGIVNLFMGLINGLSGKKK